MSDASSFELELRLLGGFEVLGRSGPLQLGSRKERALLALLALRSGRYLSTETLIEELWSEERPAQAGVVLRGLLSRIRRALDARGVAPVLETKRGVGYRLGVLPDAVDATRFDRLVGTGRRALVAGSPEEALVDLTTGLGLWRGAPLGEFSSQYPFARTSALRLEELHLEATEDLVEAQLALGQPAEALAQIQGHVDDHPYRERAWGLLMATLYRLGRQADALRAFRQLRGILAENLGIEPSPALCHLERQVLLQSPQLEGLSTRWAFLQGTPGDEERPPGHSPHPAGVGPNDGPEPMPAASPLPRRSSAPASGHLPARLSHFHGRQREVADILALVGASRLVTLTGVGGVGKSRLVVEAASQLLDRFPDGIVFAELAPIVNGDLVADHLLDRIGDGAGSANPGQSAVETLCRQLEARGPLLVVDNCEHLIEAVARIVERLLERCPRLCVLATSRESLGVDGEVAWSVPPMSLPAEGAHELRQLSHSDAVALFCERARAADPGFRLTADNAAEVAHVCRRLDGLPLALELAAARLSVLSLGQIVRRLDQRLRLLSGGPRTATRRHRTLKDAMDWSHQLLASSEQLAFRRLAVFVGSFGVEAAERVVDRDDLAPDVEVLDVLASLVAKSLLVVEAGGREKRYRLLETVREYARECLAVAGETELVQRRHGQFFLDLLRHYGAGDPRANTGDWLRRFDVEYDNLRATLEWALASDSVDACLEVIGALRLYWLFAGRLSEACHWYEWALAQPSEGATPARVAALNGFGLLVLFQRGDREHARRLHREALEAAQAIADPLGGGLARFHLGLIALQDAQVEVAQRLLEDARAAFGQAGWPASAAWCEFPLGWVTLQRGDLAGAEATFTFVLEAGRRFGSDDLVAHALGVLGTLAALGGDRKRALRLADQAVELARALSLDELLAMALVRAAEVSVILGRSEEAEASMCQALELLRSMGGPGWVADCRVFALSWGV